MEYTAALSTTTTPGEEYFADMLPVDLIAPGRSVGGQPDTGELRLVRAVLEVALREYFRPRTNWRATLVIDNAGEWIFRDDLLWPMSFINICGALGVDPEYLRRGCRAHRAALDALPSGATGHRSGLTRSRQREQSVLA